MKRCHDCDSFHEHTTKVGGYFEKQVCDECITDYRRCSHCEGLYAIDDLKDIKGNKEICWECEKVFPRCDGCEERVYEDELHSYNGNRYCNECNNYAHEEAGLPSEAYIREHDE